MNEEFEEVERKVCYAVATLVASGFDSKEEADAHIERMGKKRGPDLFVLELTTVTSILKD